MAWYFGSSPFSLFWIICQLWRLASDAQANGKSANQGPLQTFCSSILRHGGHYVGWWELHHITPEPWPDGQSNVTDCCHAIITMIRLLQHTLLWPKYPCSQYSMSNICDVSYAQWEPKASFRGLYWDEALHWYLAFPWHDHRRARAQQPTHKSQTTSAIIDHLSHGSLSIWSLRRYLAFRVSLSLTVSQLWRRQTIRYSNNSLSCQRQCKQSDGPTRDLEHLTHCQRQLRVTLIMMGTLATQWLSTWLSRHLDSPLLPLLPLLPLCSACRLVSILRLVYRLVVWDLVFLSVTVNLYITVFGYSTS